MDVLVESFLDEVLRFVAGEVGDAGVEKDEPQVERRAKHEHVRVQLQLGDGRRWQRVTHSHQAHVLQLHSATPASASSSASSRAASAAAAAATAAASARLVIQRHVAHWKRAHF